MQPFVLNRHGRLVFPSNVFPELDSSVIRSRDQLDRVVRRDFETKAPTGTEMLRRIETDAYADRERRSAAGGLRRRAGGGLCRAGIPGRRDVDRSRNVHPSTGRRRHGFRGRRQVHVLTVSHPLIVKHGARP